MPDTRHLPQAEPPPAPNSSKADVCWLIIDVALARIGTTLAPPPLLLLNVLLTLVAISIVMTGVAAPIAKLLTQGNQGVGSYGEALFLR